MTALAHSVSLKSLAAVLGGGRFSPLALFAASEPGGWYDPSDLTTLFQDAAGTTPVTAVEQPVGLVLDKSKGLVLGATELVSNGTFGANITGWAAQSANVTISWDASAALKGVTAASSGIGVYTDITTVAGKWYFATARIKANTDQTYFEVWNGDYGSRYFFSQKTTSGSFVTFSGYFLAIGTSTRVAIAVAASGQTFYVDDVSVRELPGNHLSQSTSTARPVLSARVNLLTYTEQFDNAVWSKHQQSSTIPVVTADQATAPNGTNTADEIAFGASGTGSQGSYLFYSTTSTTASVKSLTFYVKAKAAGDVGKVLTYYKFDGTPKDTKNVTLTANWQQVEASTGTLSSNELIIIGNMGSGYGGVDGQAAFSCYIWGADLRPANAGVGLPAYQRVVDAATYDTTGFPAYIKHDGVDDRLLSANGMINTAVISSAIGTAFSATGKVLFGISHEATAHTDPYFRFVNYIAGGPQISVRINGTASFSSTNSELNKAYVLETYTAASRNAVIQNGSTLVTPTTTTITYPNSTPLIVGGNAIGGEVLNGGWYNLVIIGRDLTDAERTSLRTYMNSKTKAF